MATESALRFAFWALIGLVLVMRVYFLNRLRQSGERIMPDSTAIRHEGRGIFAFRLVGFFALLGTLALYAIQPAFMVSLSIPAPDWLRWLGCLIGLVSLAVWSVVQIALSTHWSPQLRTRESQLLITTGPYATVRHPMYTAISGYALGLALLTCNWLFVALAFLVVVGLVLRVPREEQMMREAFGQAYTSYMDRTGRYFPRWLTHPSLHWHSQKL